MRIVLYTGQEFDQEYHLYNYNARLYDPIMARFITADTIVPDWTNPQSLNRYSYVMNNPLKYTDPSGNFPWAALLWALAGGAAAGAAIAAVSGGDIAMGAVTGAITAGMFFGAGEIISAAAGKAWAAKGVISWQKVAIHATAGTVSGGINAGITGGNILQGMLIGAVSGGAGMYVGLNLPDNFTAQLAGRMATGAVIGGAAAEISGGDFAQGAFQGAWTSGFAFVFNCTFHNVINAVRNMNAAQKILLRNAKILLGEEAYKKFASSLGGKLGSDFNKAMAVLGLAEGGAALKVSGIIIRGGTFFGEAAAVYTLAFITAGVGGLVIGRSIDTLFLTDTIRTGVGGTMYETFSSGNAFENIIEFYFE